MIVVISRTNLWTMTMLVTTDNYDDVSDDYVDTTLHYGRSQDDQIIEEHMESMSILCQKCIAMKAEAAAAAAAKIREDKARAHVLKCIAAEAEAAEATAAKIREDKAHAHVLKCIAAEVEAAKAAAAKIREDKARADVQKTLVHNWPKVSPQKCYLKA